MRPATLAYLAARDGLPIPPPLPAGVQHGWETFQDRYEPARSAVRTRDDAMRVVREAIADNAADGGERQIRPAHRHSPYGVVGVGLSNDERLGRVADLAPASRDARRRDQVDCVMSHVSRRPGAASYKVKAR